MLKIPSFTIGRAIDINYKSNLFALILFVISIFVFPVSAKVLTGDFQIMNSLGNSFLVLTLWMLLRELIPTNDFLAYLVPIIFSVTIIILQLEAVFIAYSLLLILSARLLTECTGKKVTLSDLLAVFVISVFSFAGTGQFISLIILPLIIIIKELTSNFSLVKLLNIFSSLILLFVTFFALRTDNLPIDLIFSFVLIISIVLINISSIKVLFKKDTGNEFVKADILLFSRLFILTLAFLMILFSNQSINSFLILIFLVFAGIVFDSIYQLLKLKNFLN